MSRLAKTQVLVILPVACAWARLHEWRIVRNGLPLNREAMELARKVGVARAEKVRVLRVREVPPMSSVLRWMGTGLGVISGQTIGMTLRHGIYIHEDYGDDRRLLAHELAHVAQYERLGGFWGFLRVYLVECLEEGYPLGALEQEAKRLEKS